MKPGRIMTAMATFLVMVSLSLSYHLPDENLSSSCQTIQSLPITRDYSRGMFSCTKDLPPLSGAPQAIITSQPDNPSNQTSAEFSFTSDSAGSSFQCAIDNAEWTSCTSPQAYSGLSEGDHEFRVWAFIDPGYMGKPYSYVWTIVLTNPETTITSHPSNPSDSTDATFEFVCSESNCTFECQLDGGGWVTCVSPQNYYGLEKCAHTFEVRASDESLNPDPSPARYSWSISNNWSLMSSGLYHTCAIHKDGSLWCWGFNDWGQLGTGTNESTNIPVQVGSDTDWETITAGYHHTCALKSGGTLWCWGLNKNGQLGIGSTINQSSPIEVAPGTYWSEVSVGSYSTCAIGTTGSLWCWGFNDYGQLGDGTWADRNIPNQVPGMESGVETVSGGGIHTCAKKSDGTIWCWGGNANGQLGIGSTTIKYSPQQVGSGSDWSLVAALGNHSCGIKSDNSLWCWGNNGNGQLGDGTNTQQTSPTQVGTDTDWTSVDGGGWYTCGTKSGGTIFCWGGNDLGQLGNGTFESMNNPTQIGEETDWEFTEGGLNQTCGLKSDGRLFCWGDNRYGQLGDGTGSNKTSPTRINTDTNWVTVGGGSNYTCGAKNDGTLWCWGYRGYGHDGTPDIIRNIPTQVGAATNWAIFDGSSGLPHTCGVQNDGTLWCWGYNYYGQLGIGSTTDQFIPTQVGSDTSWSLVTAGTHHTCGIRNDGTLWCWGYNDYGQLGIGPPDLDNDPIQYVQYNYPFQVTSAGNSWTFVTAGFSHNCGIQTNGTLWCWGNNSYGQMGDGTTLTKWDPVQIGTDTDWISVDGGDSAHTCGIKTNGTLWCWGNNSCGQVGDGTTTNKTIPTQVGSNTNWVSVFVGEQHTCGLKTDGTLWCWGRNSSGQLGDGTTINTNTPIQIGTGIDWTAGFGGGYHTCGLRTDGTLWCWGNNASGQIGDGSSWKNYPVQVP